MKDILNETDMVNIIGSAECSLNNCFEILLSIKNHQDNLDNSIMNFQPNLADCLYSLMDTYNVLKSQERYLIEQKNSLSIEIFTQLIRVNAKRIKMINECIKIGLSLGDAFAWLFFLNNREELDYHLFHPSTGLFPSNIGGKGEIEFLKRNPCIDGLYVIYHGITDMLRVGDFSLFQNGYGIVGNGEIKSEKVGSNLKVFASIYSKVDIDPPKAMQSDLSFEDSIRQMTESFPRLLRQMKAQEQLMSIKHSDYSSEFVAEFDYEAVNKLSISSPFSFNSDSSLLLYSRWSKYQSLYEVLREEENIEISNEFSTYVQKLINPNSSFNAIYYGDLDLRILPSRIPAFWWNINDCICRDLYFKRISITTIFNPSVLLEMFINKGFNVVAFGNVNDLKLEKVYKNKRIEFNNLQLYIDLISRNFMKTKSVFECAYEVISAIENGKIPENTKIDLHIHPYN